MIFIKLTAITVILVMGMKIVTSNGMLLEKMGNWLRIKSERGKKFYDLFVCPFCMNTLQVFVAHVFAFGLGILPLEFNWALLFRIPLIVGAASFISGNLWNLYEISNCIKDRNEAQEKYYNVKTEEILDGMGEDELGQEYYDVLSN